MILAGVMSGTSADGCDVALMRIGPAGRWQLLGFSHTAYPAALRHRILAAASGVANAQAIALLHVDLGRRFGLAVRAAARRHRASLDAVACHGQTIFHQGRRATLQVGDAATLALLTGAPVIHDFRAADLAQGGEGAPLVPWADWHLFGHRRQPRIALNLGGIANLTFLPPGRTPQGVWGFDTGPGNMACDALMQQLSNGRQLYDKNGVLASLGHSHEPLLRTLLRHPYCRRHPPKSTGREQFGAAFVTQLRQQWPRLSPEDLMATLVQFTASTVARGLSLSPPCAVIVAGGGLHNRTLMAALRSSAPQYTFLPSDSFGVPPQAREAMAFALLGAAHLRRQPANLPRVTGARSSVVLGSYTPAPEPA